MAAGIELPNKERHRRVLRAERYAKIGTENLWFFLLPAPPEFTKTTLTEVEAQLVLASNAMMFGAASAGAADGRPMLNFVAASEGLNPYVSGDLKRKYFEWLDGGW